jgi:hypothetical protein
LVTYYDPYVDPRQGVLFMQDATGAIFVSTAPGTLPIHAGMLVDVTGVSGAGDFAPIVEHGQVRVLGESRLPATAPLTTLSHLMTGADDAQWVALEGVVRSSLRRAHNDILELATAHGQDAR